MSNAVVMITPRVIVAVGCGADGAGMIRQAMERIMWTPSEPATALRMVLRLNAGSSLLIGMAMALAPQAMASLCLAGPVQILGIDGAGWIRLVGLALFPFAAMVFWISDRPESRSEEHTAELQSLIPHPYAV